MRSILSKSKPKKKMKQRIWDMGGGRDIKRRVSIENADIAQASLVGTRDMKAEHSMSPSTQMVSSVLRGSALPGRRNSNLRVEVRAGAAVVETDEQLDIRAETRKRLNKKGRSRQTSSLGPAQGNSATDGRPGSAIAAPERPDSRQSHNSEDSYARSEFWDASPANSRPTSAFSRPASAKFERPDAVALRDPARECRRLAQNMVTQRGNLSGTETIECQDGGFGDNMHKSAEKSDDRVAKKCLSKIRKSDMYEEEIVTYALRLETRLDVLRDKRITERADGNPWSAERRKLMAAGQSVGRTALHGSAHAAP